MSGDSSEDLYAYQEGYFISLIREWILIKGRGWNKIHGGNIHQETDCVGYNSYPLRHIVDKNMDR